MFWRGYKGLGRLHKAIGKVLTRRRKCQKIEVRKKTLAKNGLPVGICQFPSHSSLSSDLARSVRSLLEYSDGRPLQGREFYEFPYKNSRNEQTWLHQPPAGRRPHQQRSDRLPGAAYRR